MAARRGDPAAYGARNLLPKDGCPTKAEAPGRPSGSRFPAPWRLRTKNGRVRRRSASTGSLRVIQGLQVGAKQPGGQANRQLIRCVASGHSGIVMSQTIGFRTIDFVDAGLEIIDDAHSILRRQDCDRMLGASDWHI